MKPKSVAVVGASQRLNRATRVIGNLQRFGYAGQIFPINAKYTEIAGLPCYPDLGSTPEVADTVVVAIPAADVPAVLAGAAARGVRGAVVLSSGFGEAGPVGRERQAVLERLAAAHGLLICGPNCYGVFNIRHGSATFSADFSETPRAGGVAIVSQSGGFSHNIGEHLMQQRAVGLSYIVSCGNQAGVAVEEYVDFLLRDDDTSFLAGLGSFALGHGAYVVTALLVGVTWPRLAWAFPFLAVVLGVQTVTQMLAGARRHGGTAMMVAVAIYSAIISAMVITATGTSSWVAAAGAMLFAISDSIIGYNRFVKPVDRADLPIMVTYHAGQVLLILGLIAAG
jgi:uncharacterized membrane protein YhhN